MDKLLKNIVRLFGEIWTVADFMTGCIAHKQALVWLTRCQLMEKRRGRGMRDQREDRRCVTGPCSLRGEQLGQLS